MTIRVFLTVLLLLLLLQDVRAAQHPTIPMFDATIINAECERWLAELREQKKAMEDKRGSGGIFDQWNALAIAVNDAEGPLSLLANVHTDKATRDAADACDLKFTPFNNELFQSEKLYRRVRAAKPVNAHQAQYQRDLIENFEDAGVTLAPDKRLRAKAIIEEIDAKKIEFDKNIRDDATRVALSPKEMAGMSNTYLAAQARDGEGNYVLPLAYPSYLPFMQSATDEKARERYWRAKQNQGGLANIELLDQTVALRRELAGLYGDRDFATYTLRRRMAGTPEAVYAFLASVKDAVSTLEQRELDRLRERKAETTRRSQAETTLNRWDLAFYEEKEKQARYHVDQEALRRYFPTDRSVSFALKIAETLYGIRFVEASVPIWHPDVRYFDVYEANAKGEADRGRFIGGVYLDLFPREGKYTHAAAWPIRGASTLAQRTPISVLVTNFDRVGLNHDELETLLHEFGHVLHGVLSRTDYVDEAGTNVRRDFVEAPSQMFEEWARRAEPLKLFATICPDCPHLTSTQIQELDNARKLGSGIQYARQWLYAAFDMALTTAKPKGALDTWAALEKATPLGHVEGTLFPASFGHLMGGYAAGYYGYMWSQVIALDMLSAYRDHLLDPTVGHRYRAQILSQGGQVPAEALVEKFLGRKPDNAAFFKEITGQR